MLDELKRLEIGDDLRHRDSRPCIPVSDDAIVSYTGDFGNVNGVVHGRDPLCPCIRICGVVLTIEKFDRHMKSADAFREVRFNVIADFKQRFVDDGSGTPETRAVDIRFAVDFIF